MAEIGPSGLQPSDFRSPIGNLHARRIIAAIDGALTGGRISSVFGRIGDVVAVIGDYSASFIGNDSSVPGATVRDALEALAGVVAGGGVGSVFGRTGLVLAVLGDYASSLVTNDSSVTGTTVKDALDALKGAVDSLAASVGGVDTRSNKRMQALVTAADGDMACAVAMAKTPAPNSYVGVTIDGIDIPEIGDGTKVGCIFYFSGDNGSTARAWSAIQQGDTCHFNGSVAGYQLATTDIIEFIYEEAD